METVAVFFGGRSTEHDVSIITALSSVIKPLELSRRYRVEAVYIAKDGSWHWGDRFKDISLFSSGSISEVLQKTRPLSIQFDNGMTLVRSSGIAGRQTRRRVDVAFPAMHGTYGEDGALMGLLEMAGVPYVGCGVSAAAVAMDKVLAKQVVSAQQIPVTPFLSFNRSELERDLPGTIKAIKAKLDYPLFVKPAHLGSSIGITQATDDTSLRNGIEVAAHYDERVLVETAVQNLIEVTLPVLGNEQLTPGLLERPLTKTKDFFDFDAKYLHGGKKAGPGKNAQGYSQLPADIPPELYKQAEEIGLHAYRALGCSGIARVDMLIDSKTKQVYFNEVNPLPGSLYAHNWNKAGISNIELVQKLISLAKERYAQRQVLTTTFTTNYLQQF